MLPDDHEEFPEESNLLKKHIKDVFNSSLPD